MTIAMLVSSYTQRLLITHAMGKIHRDVLEKIMRAPINTFFDVTPTGLIITRFNEDMRKFEEAVHLLNWGLDLIMHLVMTLW